MSAVKAAKSVDGAYAAIPRIIWMLWFDGWDAAPVLHQRCLETWRLYNREWEVRTIARLELPELLGDLMPTYERLRVAMNVLEKFGGFWIPPAAESDLLRLMLLLRFGGVWVDSTMLCRRPLDEWLPEAAASGFFAYAPESLEEKLPVMSSFLASAPKHPITAEWLRRAETHWSTPSSTRIDLGFFWVHTLFGQLVADRAAGGAAAARAAWALVPRVSGEYGVTGPHFWVKYTDRLKPPPTLEYRKLIEEERVTPMYKLTNHEVKLNDVGPDSCYWVLLEDTRRHARAYAKSVASPSGWIPGMRVCLAGLKAKPELNGAEGLLVAFDSSKVRWQVRLDDGSGTKLFKEDNLRRCSALTSLASASLAAVMERLLAPGNEAGCHK